jgi:hypothetical protein
MKSARMNPAARPTSEELLQDEFLNKACHQLEITQKIEMIFTLDTIAFF